MVTIRVDGFQIHYGLSYPCVYSGMMSLIWSYADAKLDFFVCSFSFYVLHVLLPVFCFLCFFPEKGLFYCVIKRER